MRKIFLIILICTNLFSQEKEWSFVFYNVENLFDTIDTPNKNDETFLPNTEREWNFYRYWKKQKQIAKVLRSITGESPPTIIGLCEIEGKNVLNDLVRRDPLKRYNYNIITYDAPDKRGIQVGFLYKKEFKVLKSEPLNVSDSISNFFTRDILYVKGIINTDTLHIFINHWASRRGGKDNSEHKRMRASNILTEKLNSIKSSKSNIIIAGDFNDEPFDRSIKNLTSKSKFKLINLSKSTQGTHIFQGHWGNIDQIIISENIYKKCIYKQAQIFKNKFIIDPQSKYNSPYRTYQGPFYIGGYSDHFPIFMKFEVK